MRQEITSKITKTMFRINDECNLNLNVMAYNTDFVLIKEKI